MSDQIIDAAEYKVSMRKNDDAEYRAGYDIFEDMRDKYDLRSMVLQVVEGLYTHPSGTHTMQDLEDSVDGLVYDTVSQIIPDEIPDDVTDKFTSDMISELLKYSKVLYKETNEKADTIDDYKELREYLNQTAENKGIPKKA